jgi:hypothetical protein
VHLIAMHLPFTQRVLGVSPLPVDEWLFLAGIAATILPAVELHKWWCRGTTLRRRTNSEGLR